MRLWRRCNRTFDVMFKTIKKGRCDIYQTRDEIIKAYPMKWVILCNTEFADEYHQVVLGGEVVAVGNTLDEVYEAYARQPEIERGDLVLESTWTDEEVGENAAFIYPH